MHENEIAHRDIKCENVLITDDEWVLVSDLGLAHYIQPGDIYEKANGTVAYLPPELLKLPKWDFVKPSDIWSLGVVFYKMMTNEIPYPYKIDV